MNRGIHRLVDRQVRTLGPGRHADGGGLYLIVEPSRSRRWAFIWTKAGKRREINMNWDDGSVRIRQIHPYKWTVRRITRRYTVNEG